MASSAQWEWSEDTKSLTLSGRWTASGLSGMKGFFTDVQEQAIPGTIDMAAVDKMDCAGALELVKLCSKVGVTIEKINWSGLKGSQQRLLILIEQEWHPWSDSGNTGMGFFERVGRAAFAKAREFVLFLTFFGEMVATFYRVCLGRFHFQWALLAKNIEETGFRAMGIVGLLCFLIGVVLSYQVIVMLSKYGASVYMVELTGIIMLREFGPIMAAIVIAGRTATSFAAEIGTMKVQEEVDALTVLGVEPVERLVIPKLIALLIAMPLLAVLADITSVFGSMLMAKLQAGIGFASYLHRFHNQVSVNQFWIGMCKMPVFAFVIALVGTYQGFSASSTAHSVGEKTTKAAVQSIFLVIVSDAVFSVIFSVYGV